MSAEERPPREPASAIDDAAAGWAARMDRGPLSQGDQASLDAWLAGNSRRLGALARARAVAARFDRAQALGTDYDAARFGAATGQQRSRSPIHGWILGAAVAACLAMAVGLWLHAGPEVFSTRRGEMRLVSLADGSAITLNTASKIAVRYTDAQRRIELIEGEVLFNVAKSPGRPFIVAAGHTQVLAVGTSFVVRREPGNPVQVLVREGIVEVKRAAGATADPVRVLANMRVEVPAIERLPMSPAPVTTGEVVRALAWRDGMVSLDGITLREAAAEFSRYSDVEIVVDDPAISERTVTGLFAAGNPVGFARAVAASLDLEATVEAGSVHLHR